MSEPKKKQSKKKHATKIETETYVNAVMGWIMDGHPTHVILNQVISKDWCTTERQAYRLLQKARKKWVQFEDDNIDEARKLMIMKLNRMALGIESTSKNKPAGIRTLLAVQKQIIELQGLKYRSVPNLPAPPPPPAAHDEPEDTEPVKTDAYFQSNEIDYDALPLEVLRAIANARRKPNA